MIILDIPDFIFFIGRFHTLWVHLPIGFLVIAILLEVYGKYSNQPVFKGTVTFTLLLGAASALIACVLGYFLYLSGEYEADLLDVHFWSGWVTTLLAGLAYWVSRPDKTVTQKSKNVIFGAMVIFLGITGHYGGSLTHGSDYLTAYWPLGDQQEKGMDGEASESNKASEPVQINEDQLMQLKDRGFRVRVLSYENGALEVALPNGFSGDDHSGLLQNLLALKDQIYWLDLAGTGLKDKDLEIIGQLPNLQRLRIGNNAIGDQGVFHLKHLKNLESLNLNGSQVTWASLEQLTALDSLRSVYIWNTPIARDEKLKTWDSASRFKVISGIQ